MKSPISGRSIRRGLGVFLVASLAVVGLAASPVSAEDEGHTHEKFSFSVVGTTGGPNPCVGQEEGPLLVDVFVDVEIENGREHADVTVTGFANLDSGFESQLNQQENHEVDASGNGKVEIEAQFKIHHPDTGDKFEVNTKVLLTIGDFEVVDEWVDVVISECDRG